MKTVGIIALTIIIEVILFVIVIEIGLYNVSVMSPDPGFLRWIFSTASDKSVERHAEGIMVPSLTDSSMIDEGFRHYNEMCVGCHGAPGVNRSEIGEGLYPHGPDLSRSAKELSPGELFWVIKNGIKSTGMPSFGKTHSDQKIWSIVAFLERLKTISAQEYSTMQGRTVGEQPVSKSQREMNIVKPRRTTK
jgi:mono/diheme cytochrome c family protein